MNVKCKLVSRLEVSSRLNSLVCVPVAVEDPALDPPVHHISAQHRAVMGVWVFLPLTLGHRFPAVVEHVF